MEEGVEKVQGVETVSQAAARGLEEIVTAVAGVEDAARHVATAAANNRRAAEEIQSVSSSVSAQASKHAAAAEPLWQRQAALLFENLDRWFAGRPLLNQVDKERGY